MRHSDRPQRFPFRILSGLVFLLAFLSSACAIDVGNPKESGPSPKDPPPLQAQGTPVHFNLVATSSMDVSSLTLHVSRIELQGLESTHNTVVDRTFTIARQEQGLISETLELTSPFSEITAVRLYLAEDAPELVLLNDKLALLHDPAVPIEVSVSASELSRVDAHENLPPETLALMLAAPDASSGPTGLSVAIDLDQSLSEDADAPGSLRFNPKALFYAPGTMAELAGNLPLPTPAVLVCLTQGEPLTELMANETTGSAGSTESTLGQQIQNGPLSARIGSGPLANGPGSTEGPHFGSGPFAGILLCPAGQRGSPVILGRFRLLLVPPGTYTLALYNSAGELIRAHTGVPLPEPKQYTQAFEN